MIILVDNAGISEGSALNNENPRGEPRVFDVRRYFAVANRTRRIRLLLLLMGFSSS